jgi:hypothetical protein
LVEAGEVVTRAAIPAVKKWLQIEAAEKVKLPSGNVVQPAAIPAD